jgi:regulator of protease activity HflC (stomatin/prohibitin superfamily)
MEKKDEYYQLHIGRYVFLGAIAIIGLIVLFGSFYIVGAGERGVLLTWGKPADYAIGEGLHFKIPMVQEVIIIDVKTHKYEADASAASKDLQIVSTKIAVNYRVVPETVPELYRTVGLAYEDRVIQPAVQEVVKATTAQFTAEELITRRSEVKDNIKLLLRERLSDRGISVEDISITNFDFSSSFNSAIEAKVTAEQEALAARNKLEQVKYEAEQRVARAEAEAQAITLQAQSINSQGGKDYVTLKWIEKWDGKVSLIGSGSGVTPILDMRTAATVV